MVEKKIIQVKKKKRIAYGLKKFIEFKKLK